MQIIKRIVKVERYVPYFKRYYSRQVSIGLGVGGSPNLTVSKNIFMTIKQSCIKFSVVTT